MMIEELVSTENFPIKALSFQEIQLAIINVIPLLRQAVDLYHSFQDRIIDNEFSNRLHIQMNEIKIELLRNNAIITDWKIGIVDFITIHNYLPIYVCYKLSECGIQMTHPMGKSCNERKPFCLN